MKKFLGHHKSIFKKYFKKRIHVYVFNGSYLNSRKLGTFWIFV